jgi:hypothetical protein
MRYLGLALFAEGPTDYRFLQPLLARLVEAVAAGLTHADVEIGPVEGLDAPHHRGEARVIQIVEAVRSIDCNCDLLFIHTDGAGDPEAAYRQRIEPGAQGLRQEWPEACLQVIGVVPVRELEAWCLADGQALRAVFRTSLTDEEMGLPEGPADVEQILDPKQHLDQAFDATRRKSRQRPSAAALLDELGLVVSLERLRLVPRFRRLEADLEQSIRELWHLPRS